MFRVSRKHYTLHPKFRCGSIYIIKLFPLFITSLVLPSVPSHLQHNSASLWHLDLFQFKEAAGFECLQTLMDNLVDRYRSKYLPLLLFTIMYEYVFILTYIHTYIHTYFMYRCLYFYILLVFENVIFQIFKYFKFLGALYIYHYWIVLTGKWTLTSRSWPPSTTTSQTLWTHRWRI